MQIVTAGHDSVISVWDFSTGKKVIHFCASDGVEVTCMRFDATQRRLITGFRDGSVKVWNFNNGLLLNKLNPANNLEVFKI